MRVIFIVLLTLLASSTFSQKTKAGKAPVKKVIATTAGKPTPADMAPRQTITEKYLNGPTKSGTKNTSNSPFVGGIHPADNATNTFDSVRLANPNSVDNRTATNAVIAGGNDTTFNVN
ncbi:MAG TPA: hypothetical protein VF623_14310, partial [Segetibacter sp.]